MSRKMIKVLVMGAMVLTALVSASSASAWTTNGPLNFTGTGGASTLVVQVPVGHVAAHNVGISCTGSGGTGSLNASTSVVGNFDAATLTPSFSSCRIGINAATVSCGAATLTAVSYASPVTTGFVKNITCTITVATCVITVSSTGSGGHAVDGTYNNSGVLTIRGGSPSTQTLTASWGNTTACNNIFNTGTAGDPHAAPSYFGNGTQTVAGFPDSLTQTVTSSPIPSITLP